MANSADAEYHERSLTQRDLLEFLSQMVHFQDEPIADLVGVPVYYLSKLARDNGVTVCHVERDWRTDPNNFSGGTC